MLNLTANLTVGLHFLYATLAAPFKTEENIFNSEICKL